MNIPLFIDRSVDRRAFTLIELLVVITIIAVLAGLLLPVTQRVLENSKKVSCKNTELHIIAAVNSYQTEYGQYPVSVTAGAAPADTTFGTASATNPNNGVLFDVLRALNQVDAGTGVLLNSRRVPYFESKNVKSATNPRDGFILTGTPTGNPLAPTPPNFKQGDLVDPWGNWYAVRIDTGYTNAVVNPYKDDSSAANDTPDATTGPTQTELKEQLRTGVISWSYGNDGTKGDKGTVSATYSPTPGDDVDSWQ